MKYYIQRLKGPINYINPYRNLGLSAGFQNKIQTCFSFDHMGNSNFEFGANEKSLNEFAAMADKKLFVTFEQEVENGETIYGIMQKNFFDEAQGFIESQLAHEWPRNCIEVTLMHQTILNKDTDCSYVGWYDLQNKAFYFAGKKGLDAFVKTTEFFHITFSEDQSLDLDKKPDSEISAPVYPSID